jgi:hypothetical protein
MCFDNILFIQVYSCKVSFKGSTRYAVNEFGSEEESREYALRKASTDEKNIQASLRLQASHASLSRAPRGLKADTNARLIEDYLFVPHCSNFETGRESEYQRHNVIKHPGKPGYPDRA